MMQLVEASFADAINNLAAPLRDVLLLHDVRGLSARAVGAALGLGTPQAQIALLYARRAVRQRLVDAPGRR